MSEITFEGYAILELMGHRQRGGYVKDVEMFGGKLLRIDIPVAPDKTVTEFYGCSSIYALRPCTEEIARDFVKNSYDGDIRPVQPLSYRPRPDEPGRGGAAPPLLDRGGEDYLDDEAA